jgi:hypothetical protein
MSRLLLLALSCLLLTVTGCYRLQPPAEIGETVRVEIMVNNARLVRSQPYLQKAVADALAATLGWHVSPNGTAKLQLTIDVEDISSSGTDAYNTPSRWTIVLKGQALLACRRGNAIGQWSGSGYASALMSAQDDQPSAIKNAATNAATTIAAWLEAQAQTWPAVATK